MSDKIIASCVLVFYFSMLMYMAHLAFRRTKKFDDYIMGGRSLSPALCAMNAGASDMSSWLMMGLPGAFYLYGMNNIWMVIGLIFGSWASWTIVAKRLRVYTEIAGNAITIPMFLENRFQDNAKTIRNISSIVTIVFFTIYIASGLMGGAKLFSEFLSVDYKLALFISAISIVGYACLGGFLAISWADLIQGLMMLFALLIIPSVMIFDNSLANFSIIDFVKKEQQGYLNPFSNVNFSTILALFGWGLGYFGQPHIISKYMAIRNPNELNISRNICISWMSLSMLAAAALGIIGHVFFADISNPENIFITASFQLFHPLISGLLLAALLSAIMSTINGQIIICSGSLVEDLYKQYLNKSATDKEKIFYGRLSILAITIIASIIALDQKSSILSVVGYAWAGLGSSFGPAILFSLFSRNVTKNSILFGILSGGISCILLIFAKIDNQTIYAFFISSLTIYIVSVLDKKNRCEKVVKVFDQVNVIVNERR